MKPTATRVASECSKNRENIELPPNPPRAPSAHGVGLWGWDAVLLLPWVNPDPLGQSCGLAQTLINGPHPSPLPSCSRNSDRKDWASREALEEA